MALRPLPAEEVVELWVGRPAPDYARLVLARYVEAPRLRRGRHGKPHLCTPHDSLQFNLSHAGGVALLAVSSQHPVGVDVEPARRWSDPAGFARRFLSPVEAARVASLPARVQSVALTRLWTAKEAYVKALGTGLGATAARSFTIDGGAVVQTHDGAPASAWTLRELELGRGMWATVARCSPTVRLEVLDLAAT